MRIQHLFVRNNPHCVANIGPDDFILEGKRTGLNRRFCWEFNRKLKHTELKIIQDFYDFMVWRVRPL